MTFRRWSLVACGVSLLAACSDGESYEDDDYLAASQALVQNGTDVSLKVTSDWGQGYCADVTLKNNSASNVTDWRVTLDMKGSTLGNGWNGTFTGTTGLVNVAPAAHNKLISAGGSATFGFCASSANSSQRAILSSISITGGGTSSTGGTSTGGAASGGGTTSTGATTSTGSTTSTGATAGTGASSTGGTGGSTGGTTTGGTGGVTTGGTGGATTGGTGGTGGTTSCQTGTTGTTWATNCPTAPYRTCTAGTWQAAGAENGAPLRLESAHFAIYWKDGTTITQAQAQSAINTLETIWNQYFGAPMYFPEPYCSQSAKYKASVHFDNSYPLWGGAWGNNYMGMWVGPGAASDHWGLAHEFMHGVQSVSKGLACGGPETSNYCGWIYESHANFAPHQLTEYDNNVHCSEMLANAPHLYLGSTRDRYCNWQFMEFLKDKQCHKAVNDIWTTTPASNDPFSAIMKSRGWSISQANDFFGDWAMHNITWDYKESGAAYRSSFGAITDTSRPERRNRITRLEPLDSSYASTRRFRSPYYSAPQRYGYNIVRLQPESGKTSVTVKFRGVVQSGANSDWRWGLVATNSALTTARYSPLQKGSDGELTFCISPGELVWLVVTGTPSVQQQIYWDQPYASIYRYPYMVELTNAWPDGFQNGAPAACPSGTERHENGGGCAPANLATSVYVGPHAQVLGGTVSGTARIEDEAVILNGATVTGGVVGGLSVLSRFTVKDSAQVRATFYPPGFFESGQGLSGTAQLLGDIEYRGQGTNKTSGSYSGFVDAGTASRSINEVTVAPPYAWRQ